MASMPRSSALSELIAANESIDHHSHPTHLVHLAHQIRHNLAYQHNWTQLEVHAASPLPPFAKLPRLLISGVPPSPIYVHPDEQVAHPTAEATSRPQGRERQELEGSVGGDAVSKKEWVLPTHLKEAWTLGRFAEVFDSLSNGEKNSEAAKIQVTGGGQLRKNVKRMLLAILSDDSTIVYYIMHDGIVKPRQN